MGHELKTREDVRLVSHRPVSIPHYFAQAPLLSVSVGLLADTCVGIRASLKENPPSRDLIARDERTNSIFETSSLSPTTLKQLHSITRIYARSRALTFVSEMHERHRFTIHKKTGPTNRCSAV